jgi:hypothetical protein
VLLIISHMDLGLPEDKNLRALEHEAARFGVSVLPLSVASFSDNPEVKPGTGIAELLSETINCLTRHAPGPFWPHTEPSSEQRAALQFRDRGGR